MKKITSFLLTLTLILSVTYVNVNALAPNTTNPKSDFYNGFIESDDKRIFFGDTEVKGDEFANIINDLTYSKYLELEKNGYVFSYSTDIIQTRAFDQRIKKYQYSGLNKAINYDGTVYCRWVVFFTCMYTVNGNTGAVGSVSEPRLTLQMGEVSNVLSATVFLDNQSAYISKIGSNYVDFGYRFTIAANAQFGLTMKLIFTTRQGVERL